VSAATLVQPHVYQLNGLTVVASLCTSFGIGESQAELGASIGRGWPRLLALIPRRAEYIIADGGEAEIYSGLGFMETVAIYKEVYSWHNGHPSSFILALPSLHVTDGALHYPSQRFGVV